MCFVLGRGNESGRTYPKAVRQYDDLGRRGEIELFSIARLVRVGLS